MTPRLTELIEWDTEPGEVIYRCGSCSRLVRGPLGLHGDRHQECGVGRLGTVARLTRQMLQAHETAELIGALEVGGFGEVAI